MSRDINPFGLRMPPELREDLEQAAKENGRSLNSELLLRLSMTLDDDWAKRTSPINQMVMFLGRLSEVIGTLRLLIRTHDGKVGSAALTELKNRLAAASAERDKVFETLDGFSNGIDHDLIALEELGLGSRERVELLLSGLDSDAKVRKQEGIEAAIRVLKSLSGDDLQSALSSLKEGERAPKKGSGSRRPHRK